MTHTIIAYNLLGGWFFDDARHGLVAEALIEGADTAIDKVLALAGRKAKHVRIRFSDRALAGLCYEANQVDRTNGGTDYEFATGILAGHRAWLCPALECYFKTPPKRLHMDIMPVAPEAMEAYRELASLSPDGI